MPVDFAAPESSPSDVVNAVDQPGLQVSVSSDVCDSVTCQCVRVCLNHQVRGTEGDNRGLLWVLDEEMLTPGSSENTVLERVCQYFSGTGTCVTSPVRVSPRCFFFITCCVLCVLQCVSVNSLCIVRSLI